MGGVSARVIRLRTELPIALHRHIISNPSQSYALSIEASVRYIHSIATDTSAERRLITVKHGSSAWIAQVFV